MLDDVQQGPNSAEPASPPYTEGEAVFIQSELQDRLRSNHAAEASGRVHPELAPFAHQLRLKRQALSALLSNKVAPSTILARLKPCNASKVRF